MIWTHKLIREFFLYYTIIYAILFLSNHYEIIITIFYEHLKLGISFEDFRIKYSFDLFVEK